MRRANEFQRTDLDLILFIRFSLDVYINNNVYFL